MSLSSRNAQMKETSTIKPRQTMRGHTDTVWDVAHLPSRRQIITCSEDGSLRLWNLESGAQIGDEWRDEEEKAGVTIIALSPNGKTVASGGRDGRVKLWDVEGQKVIAKGTGHSDMVESLCWSGDGQRVLSGSDDGTAKVWNVERGQTVLSPIKTGHEQVYVAIYSHDTTRIATGGKEDVIAIGPQIGNEQWRKEDQSVKPWPDKRGKPWLRLVVPILFPDSKRIASGSRHRKVKWCEVKRRKVVAKWEGHSVMVESLCQEELHPGPPSSSFLNVDVTNSFGRHLAPSDWIWNIFSKLSHPPVNESVRLQERPKGRFHGLSDSPILPHANGKLPERTPERNIGGEDDDAECDKDVDRPRNNDESKVRQVLPVRVEAPPSDDLPAAHDNVDNRMLQKSLLHARGKDTSSNHDDEENKEPSSCLGLNLSSSQRKGSTSPYSKSTATEKQPRQESTDASDSLQDLTNYLQGKSDYPIASGGYGDIWKCELVKASETVEVAVKTIRAYDAGNDVLVRKNSKRVRREVNIWGRLKHDCILPLWGVANNFGPYPAMICPWVKNGSLTGFLERKQDTLSSQDKFSLLNDIALGLQYLHDKTIIHGDLTGSNVLVHGNGRACLADFGLSTVMEFIGTSYFTSTIKGNIRWAAAELFEVPEDDEEDGAAVSLSTECDIYSFGSIVLQVLTCKVPYCNVKKDNVVLGQVIRGKKPEAPKESQIAPSHWDLIERCWLARTSRPSVREVVAFVACERQALVS